MYKGFLYSTSLSTFTNCRLFDDSRSDSCEVISLCLDLYFSNNWPYYASFHALVNHVNIFLKKMSIPVFIPVFDWVTFLIVPFMSCLFILDINSLVSHIFGKYFLPFFRLSFHFVVSFVLQKLLNLIRSHLFIFAFISFALGDRNRNIATVYVRVSCLCSSRNFIVLGLTFMSLIHLSLFLYMVWRSVLISFILLHVALQFSHHHLLKRRSFSPLYILASFVID